MRLVYALLTEEYDREGLHTYADVVELFEDKELAFRVQWEMSVRQSTLERASTPYWVAPWRLK